MKIDKTLKLLVKSKDEHNTRLAEESMDYVVQYNPITGITGFTKNKDGTIDKAIPARLLQIVIKLMKENEMKTLSGKAVKEKTLGNTSAAEAKKNVTDIVTFGDGDTWELICKASSVSEGWLKSTKAMEIPGVGCLVQVTTQQGTNVSEAVTFVPNVKIERQYETETGSLQHAKVVSRKLVTDCNFEQFGIQVGTISGGCACASPGPDKEVEEDMQDEVQYVRDFGLAKEPDYNRFKRQLETVINCLSMENNSNTPDFVLANYLVDCLTAFDEVVTTNTEKKNGDGRKIGILEGFSGEILPIIKAGEYKFCGMTNKLLAIGTSNLFDALQLAVQARREYYGFPQNPQADLK
jgi:hypothetical protein